MTNTCPPWPRTLVVALVLSAAACDRAAVARGDSLQTLATQLSSQKDSLTRVVLDADAFIGQIDSAISTVKGLPRNQRAASDPLADQLQARKDMQARVNALVSRAKATAAQLAAVQRRQLATQRLNDSLMAKAEADAQLIVDLSATIERQRNELAALGVRLDSLRTEVATLGGRVYKAYYVVGSEKELMDKGVIVKEGGANLLIARPGRTLVPARVLNPDVFTPIDQREVTTIQVPDTNARYRLVSRQPLDAADVQARDGNTFKGALKIAKTDEFWAPSRFLILVRQ